MADIAPAINAFATGYGISRTNRLDKETSQSNALSRKVTETNLLRQQQSDTGKLVTSLDAAFAKAAQWADTPEKWPAVQQYMGNAIAQATQFGLPPDLAQKFAEAVTQTSYEQRGPIAAQAGGIAAEKPTSALEEARRAVQAGTATPDQRRMAGVLVKEGTGSQNKPMSPTQKQAELKLKAMEDFLAGSATPQQERLIGADADPLVREAIQAVMSRAGAQALTADEFVKEVENRTQQIRAARHGETFTEWERDASGKLVLKKK